MTPSNLSRATYRIYDINIPVLRLPPVCPPLPAATTHLVIREDSC